MKVVNAFLTFIFSAISVFTYGQPNVSLTNGHEPTHTAAEGGSVLTGKITDEKTGEVLPGASIYLHDLKKGTIADDKGVYRLGNLNNGKYLIEISYKGYATIIETI